MIEQVNWDFPLPRTHTGMMLGNSTTGLLIWGEQNHLKITIGRADYWDHRGGMPWTERQNYRAIRHCLETNDAVGVKELFACATDKIPGCPHRPSVLPVGRLDLRLSENCELLKGTVSLRTGEAEIIYRHADVLRTIKVRLSMLRQEFCLELPLCEQAAVEEVPAWDFLAEYFRGVSFAPPERLADQHLRGWIQPLPADPALAVVYRREGHLVYGMTLRGEDTAELQAQAVAALDEAASRGNTVMAAENRRWWDEFWNDVPNVSLPNWRLEFLYWYGLYKFAAFTAPGGVPATLQGPWIEEYALPPWSSDYHFNINVQMCYWPAYKANRTSHLMPLFDMVLNWRPHLRRIARDFIAIDDGYMLPHAVDDRCTCMGGFWTGVIDHGCTAWVAQMMYQYYCYTGDLEFLRGKAFDFMKGALRVYEAMLEKRNGKYVLPVSVSPEYRGANMNAWGANASFQLAAVHRLCEDLIRAAEILGETADPVWNDISRNLPRFTTIGEPDAERIALWEGVDLEESHRHHSHLGGICPFDAIDTTDGKTRAVVNRSINHWIKQGMGLWSGWCMPWASMLHSRFDNGRMAEMMLEIWAKVFTNIGHGTLHDVEFPGFSLMGAPDVCTDKAAVEQTVAASCSGSQRREIMQMDAGMGALTAIQDMLLHSRRGVIHVFPGAPSTWRQASFADMPCEGCGKISAVLTDGRVREITLSSKSGGVYRLAKPWTGNAKIVFADQTTECASRPVMELTLTAGASCVIMAAE